MNGTNSGGIISEGRLPAKIGAAVFISYTTIVGRMYFFLFLSIVVPYLFDDFLSVDDVDAARQLVYLGGDAHLLASQVVDDGRDLRLRGDGTDARCAAVTEDDVEGLRGVADGAWCEVGTEGVHRAVAILELVAFGVQGIDVGERLLVQRAGELKVAAAYGCLRCTLDGGVGAAEGECLACQVVLTAPLVAWDSDDVWCVGLHLRGVVEGDTARAVTLELGEPEVLSLVAAALEPVDGFTVGFYRRYVEGQADGSPSLALAAGNGIGCRDLAGVADLAGRDVEGCEEVVAVLQGDACR